MRDYRGDLSIANDIGDVDEVQACKASHRQRAKAFLSSGVAAGAAGTDDGPVERNRKRYRVKSLEWGIAVDNGLRVSTGLGFERYDITEAIRTNADPFGWPMLSIAPDQGLSWDVSSHP